MSARKWRVAVWIPVAAAALSLCSTASGQPAYVRVVNAAAAPGGDGRTWATAINDLQRALDAAEGSGGAVTEIWVARGTYTPSRPAGWYATFALLNGVGIYGGFAGSELRHEERDPATHISALSPSLGENGPVRRLVTATGVDQSAVLDGFWLNQEELSTSTGIYAQPGSPTLRNLIVSRFNDCGLRLSGSARVTACRIEGCHTSGSGGGAELSGNVVIENCTFAGNGAANAGGGVAGSGAFINCTFSRNGADEGGAAIADPAGAMSFTSCTFDANYAGFGGGGVAGAATTLVRDSAFINNVGVAGGGGMEGGTARRCTFLNNSGMGGGAVAGTCTVVDSLIAGNSASRGAAASDGATLINCTVVANRPGQTALEGVTAINSIIWNNCVNGDCSQARQVSRSTVNSCTVQGWDGSLGGANNNGLDPMFVDPAHGDYHPLAASPCIDSGDNLAVPAGAFRDLEGRARFFDAPALNMGIGAAPIVDRGCYEFGAPAFCYANIDGSATPPAANINDFVAFLRLFAAAHPLANCDGSTTAPTLNVADFVCFQARFAEGCP